MVQIWFRCGSDVVLSVDRPFQSSRHGADADVNVDDAADDSDDVEEEEARHVVAWRARRNERQSKRALGVALAFGALLCIRSGTRLGFAACPKHKSELQERSAAERLEWDVLFPTIASQLHLRPLQDCRAAQQRRHADRQPPQVLRHLRRAAHRPLQLEATPLLAPTWQGRQGRRQPARASGGVVGARRRRGR